MPMTDDNLSAAQRQALGGYAKALDKALTTPKAAALAKARAARAVAQPRTAPAGYRSVEHFLDSAQETMGRRPRGASELAAYLRVNHANIRRWLVTRERIPMQPTLDAIASWITSLNR